MKCQVNHRMFGDKVSIASLLVVTMVASGCGDFGGGASVIPTVTFLPADVSGASSEAVVDPGAATEVADPSAGGVGSIRGRVVLQGDSIQLPVLIAQGADVKDKEVCAAVDVPDERLVVGADNGVANVFVYLPKKPKKMSFSAPVEPLIFDQKNCRFLPHCLIVPTGQVVKVLSDDAVAHNTHSYPNKNQGVNSGVAPGDREGKLTITYNRAEAEPIAVKCDYHAWMTAYHLPIDHSFAAVTDADGNFEITDLPAGDYTFAVWHEAVAGKFIERKLGVTVGSGDPTPLEISVPADKLQL